MMLIDQLGIDDLPQRVDDCCFIGHRSARRRWDRRTAAKPQASAGSGDGDGGVLRTVLAQTASRRLSVHVNSVRRHFGHGKRPTGSVAGMHTALPVCRSNSRPVSGAAI